MSLILSIDTATNNCSAVLSENGIVLKSEISAKVNSHAEVLSIMIQQMMKDSGKQLQDLSAVAISGGPGSYTGLRIGVSTAKGLCYALNIPLIAIPSLKIIAAAAKKVLKYEPDTYFAPMIDARRMEVYTALYDQNLNLVKEASAEIISQDMFDKIIPEHNIILCGNGAFKCQDIFRSVNQIKVSEEIELDAIYMVPLVHEQFDNAIFENLAYYQPFYLKDFIAGKPHVKGLE